MILSVRHKFVFVKGMKVAGTSVEMALAPLCGPDDIVTPISPVDELLRGGEARNYSADRAGEADWLHRIAKAKPEEREAIPFPAPVFYNHMSLREVLALYPNPLDGFRIVGIERSPYAKVISWANMRLTYDRYRDGTGEMRAAPDLLRRYLDQAFENGRVLDCRNIERYRRPDGALGVDVMRYADLPVAFASFVRDLGLPVPVLPHAKKGLMSDALDPRDILRPDQIARIDALFAEEFEAFGYERI